MTSKSKTDKTRPPVAKRTPRAWHCRTCRKQHPFGVWYAAHSMLGPMLHDCDRCGAVHSVDDYKITLSRRGTWPKRADGASPNTRTPKRPSMRTRPG